MLIHVDGKPIEISEDLIHKLFNSGTEDMLQRYHQMDMRYRLGIKTALRTWVFPFLEKTLKVPVRPSKELDPLDFLIQQFVYFIEDASKHAAIDIKTEGSDGTANRPTSISFTFKDSSESGRQLAFDWTEGIRKNDVREKAVS